MEIIVVLVLILIVVYLIWKKGPHIIHSWIYSRQVKYGKDECLYNSLRTCLDCNRKEHMEWIKGTSEQYWVRVESDAISD